MDIHDEFPESLIELEKYVPVINNIAANENPDTWQFLKQQDGVSIYKLNNTAPHLSSLLSSSPMPHMVKGVGTVPLSMGKFYEYMIKLSFAQRKEFDSLLEIWNIVDHLSLNNRNQLYLYNTAHQPPTRFMARREFVFIGQTYIYDQNGNQIPLPQTDNDALENWILENENRIQKILMITHSVEESEILKSKHANAFQIDPAKSVRGKIYCIANVIERIDNHSCRAQLLCDMDVGGMVPEFVKGIIAQYNPGSFIKMKVHLDKLDKQAKQQNNV